MHRWIIIVKGRNCRLKVWLHRRFRSEVYSTRWEAPPSRLLFSKANKTTVVQLEVDPLKVSFHWSIKDYRLWQVRAVMEHVEGYDEGAAKLSVNQNQWAHWNLRSMKNSQGAMGDWEHIWIWRNFQSISYLAETFWRVQRKNEQGLQIFYYNQSKWWLIINRSDGAAVMILQNAVITEWLDRDNSVCDPEKWTSRSQ